MDLNLRLMNKVKVIYTEMYVEELNFELVCLRRQHKLPSP